jgi:hypothetical protein
VQKHEHNRQPLSMNMKPSSDVCSSHIRKPITLQVSKKLITQIKNNSITQPATILKIHYKSGYTVMTTITSKNFFQKNAVI